MASNLEVGMRLHATYTDGEFYPATVAAVSESKKRSKAPVRVHYTGYGDEEDRWLSLDKLKSKKLRDAGVTPPSGDTGKAKAKAKAKGKAKAAPQINLKLLKKGMKLSAKSSDGNWYAAEVVQLSKQNKSTVKVNFIGWAKSADEWVDASSIRSKVLKEAAEAASKKAEKPKLTTKELQAKKMTSQDGFLSALDQSGGSTPKALKLYGIEESEYSGDVEMMDKVHEMRARMITNPKYNGRRVIGAILFEATMDREIGGLPTAEFLWKKKRVVPLLKIDKGLAEEKDGCQLMKDMPQLDELLDKAVAKGIFGTKERSVIKAPNEAGIKKIAEQQFEVGLKIIAKGLVPILEPEVDINAQDKAKCEELLLGFLLEGLHKLAPDQKVIFKLTIPTKTNLYLPLMGHPNTMRVVALSGGYNREDSCKQLSANAGMIASFSRAFAEGMSAKQTDEEFTATMDMSCKTISEASRAGKKKAFQAARISDQPGFFSALDQSGGSTPKALKLYGIEESEYNGEEEMFDKVHEMRSRMITNPRYNGSRVIGAILFEMTMDRKINGIPTAKYLYDVKRVVPFLKIDKGLQEEKDGCQLMKDMPELDKLLTKAVRNGIFGTKERSVIKDANEEGIKRVAEQQFEVGLKILAKGLVPILEPEVDINANQKEKCEEILQKYLLEGAAKLKPEQKVIYKLTIPTKANYYKPLIAHGNTLKVVALSGGYNREDSCKQLAQNEGMIASFSRAFAEGMSAKQSDEEFTALMDKSCETIFQASR
jgi:fructose-bisphosphate aldolase class I